MVRPSDNEIARLRIAAGEICEIAEADGFRVGNAIAQHSAFRDGRGPTSGLERALVKHAARQGAAKAGMYPDPVQGGLDLVSVDGLTERRYRVKVATYRSGVPHIVCGTTSTLLTVVQDPESIFTNERWVLCFKTDDDSTIERIFAAEIIGHEGDGPVHLVLGSIIDLDPITPPDGFESHDEDDLGEDFDLGEGDAEAG